MEEFEFIDRQPLRNPQTRASFRRQVWLQIYLPLLAGVLLLAVAAAALWTAALAGASAWADASLILLLMPVLIASLLPMALLVALSYLVILLLQRIPGPAFQAQQAIAQVQRRARQAGRIAVEPMVRVQASVAALQTGLHRLVSIFRQGE